MYPLTNNSDLHWPLSSFEKPRHARDFLNRLNGSLPVYSKTVRKIYTEYSVCIVNEREPLLLIEPDMTQFSAMFHHIQPDSIMRTSVVIYSDAQGLKLSGVLAKDDTRKTYDLKEGMFRLFSGEFVDGAFLPVITYGDLRTLPKSSQPILQLHGLRIEAMHRLSAFQVNDIVDTIKQNLVHRLVNLKPQ